MSRSGLRRRYCVFGCDITLSHRIPLHRFPNPNKRPDLFAAWVSCVGDILTEHNSQKIYNNKRVCDYHFESATKTTGSRLIASALPTISKRVSQSLATIVELDHGYCRPRREYHRNIADNDNLTSGSVPSYTAGVDLDSAPGPFRNISTPSTESTILHTSSAVQFDLASTSTSVEPVKISHNEQATSDQDPIVIEEVADDNLSFYSDDRAATPILEGDDEDALLHVGFQCNACNGEIKGFRYTCVQCSDLDLCSACEQNGTHSQHYMLRVPKPKPYMETQIVLEKIRRHLMKKLDPLADDQDPGDDISVKLEIMSDIDEDEELGKDMDIEDTGDLNMSDEDEPLIIKAVENPTESSVRKQQENNITNESTEATNRTEATSNRTGTVPSTAKRKILVPLTDIMEMLDDPLANIYFVPEFKKKCHHVTRAYLKNSNLLEPG